MTPRKPLKVDFVHAGQKHELRFAFDLERGNHRTVHAFLTGGQFYEPDISLFFQHVIKAGDHTIDIGANLGFHSLLMSALVGPAGSVTSFEPDPANIRDFKLNASLSKATNIDLHEAALSSKAAAVEIFSSKDDGGWTGVATGADAAFIGTLKGESKDHYDFLAEIRSETLDQACTRPLYRVAKIDVEGYEGVVLDGAERLLSTGACEYWIVEYAAHCLARYGEDQWSIRNRFSRHGYDCFVMPRSGRMPMHIPGRTKIVVADIINLVFARRDTIERDFAEVDVSQFVFGP